MRRDYNRLRTISLRIPLSPAHLIILTARQPSGPGLPGAQSGTFNRFLYVTP